MNRTVQRWAPLGRLPPGGAVVTVTADSPAVTVPASVTVPADAVAVTFPVTTRSVTAPMVASFPGTFGGAQQTAVRTVYPAAAPTLASLSVNPASVVGGTSSTGTVTLSAPAPSGGVVVTLSDNSAAVTVPASVTVPAG